MTPPEPVDGKIPVMLYNLAGPLMNLLAALLALGGYFLSGGGSVGASLLFLFAFAGLYLALTNGIPLRLGPIDNDGKNAFSLRRDPEAMRAFYLHGIDFALKKDTSGEIPRYLVFFKGRDADVITAAFREFSAKNLEKEKKPSIRKELEQAKQQAKVQHRQREKVKTKDRGVEL